MGKSTELAWECLRETMFKSTKQSIEHNELLPEARLKLFGGESIKILQGIRQSVSFLYFETLFLQVLFYF